MTKHPAHMEIGEEAGMEGFARHLTLHGPNERRGGDQIRAVNVSVSKIYLDVLLKSK